MKKLIIYTKSGCQYCAAAKAFLSEKAIEYVEVDIIKHPEKADWLREQGFKTLPVIFIDEEPLINGGWTTLKTMRKHEIMERLEA